MLSLPKIIKINSQYDVITPRFVVFGNWLYCVSVAVTWYNRWPSSAVVRTTTLYLFLSRYVNTLHDKPIKGFRSVHGSNPALLPCISLSQHPRQSTTTRYTTTLSSRCSTLLVQTPLYYYVFLSHSTQGGVLLHVTRRPYHYPAALSWFEPCSITMYFSHHSTQGRILPHAARRAYRHAAALSVLPGHRAARRRLDLLHLEGRSHREYRFLEQTALRISNTDALLWAVDSSKSHAWSKLWIAPLELHLSNHQET